MNLATHIPTGNDMMLRRPWRQNDRLRTTASALRGDAAAEGGAEAFAQESIALLYGDGGGAWLDERSPIDPTVFTRSAVEAEANALCIDVLRSSRVQRETYVGSWLPEPLATDADTGAAVELAESVTLAFLVVMETLSPLERVALVLHDVFGHSHDEVAAVLRKSPAAVRQLASRARRHIDEGQPRFEADADQRRQVADAFLAACTGADLDRLLEVLAPDVVLVAGGGAVPTVRQPVNGADNVAAVLLRIAGQLATDTDVRRLEVNAMPAIVAFVGGRLDTVVALHVAGDRVATVRIIRNPDKLAGLAARFERRDEAEELPKS
ncbi:MAG: sigma factor-like helix-turn-helix DNA-binding protein [Acidimicrobiales bacterium]